MVPKSTTYLLIAFRSLYKLRAIDDKSNHKTGNRITFGSVVMAVPRRAGLYQRLWNSFAEWYRDLSGYRRLGEQSVDIKSIWWALFET